MEVFNGSVLANSFGFAGSFAPCSNSSSYMWRSTFSNGGHISLFFLRLPPSSRPQAVPGSRKLRTSSCLRRQHPKRRNALREKLLGKQGQVRKILQGTTSNLGEEDSQPALNLHTERETLGSNTGAPDASPVRGGIPLTLSLHDKEDLLHAADSVGKGELGGASVLWNKLDSWVDQYKKDSETWGIGSVPIFTIHKDSDGNVTRVSLNEDEIIRRSRVETWSLQPKELRRDLMDVNSRISRAKLVAKELESGEYKVPKNSTIAKIVIEGSKSSSLIDRFYTLNCGGKMLFKLSPLIVCAFLFSCFVFWSLKQLMFTSNRIGLTREENEILRRKLKSRMKRSSIEKGSIEVLKSIPELPAVSHQRPPLDKNELMKSIKAKASTEGSAISNSDRHFDVDDEDFKDHVREIREMVKQVHELEREHQQDVDKRGREGGVCSLPDAKNKLPSIELTADLETHSTVNGSNYCNVSESNVLAEDTVILDFTRVMENSGVISSNVPCEESRKTISLDEFRDSEITENPVSGTLGRVNEMPADVSAEHAISEDRSMDMDMDALKNEEMEQGISKAGNIDLSIVQEGQGVAFDLTCSDNSSSAGKNSTSMKPKIIMSIKEARDYLSCKYVSSMDRLQFKPEAQDRCQSVSPLANGNSNAINERMKAVKLPNLDVKEYSKDNTLAHESCSRKVFDHVQKATNQKNINEPSCVAAVIGLSSMDVETSERRCSNSISPDDVEDKILQNEAFTSGTTVQGYTDGQLLEKKREGMQPFKKEGVAVKGTDDAGKFYNSDSSDLWNEEHHHQEPLVHPLDICMDANAVAVRELNSQDTCTAMWKNKIITLSSSELTSVPTPMVETSADIEMEKDNDGATCQILPNDNNSADLGPPAMCNEDAVQGHSLEAELGVNSLSDPHADFSPEFGDDDRTKMKQVQREKSWVENNFQQLDPVIKKIGVGFRENYMAARDKVQEHKTLSTALGEMALDDELEWVNDENLSKIVFKVRENELAGREPFHLMDADEQCAFFKGLERKAEKENKKLLALHEFIHSKIENIDYGMDGISVYDPLEKIIPRWKGPPISEDPEFLNNFAKRQQAVFTSKMENSQSAVEDIQDSLLKSDQTSHSDALSSSSPVQNLRKLSHDAASVNPKTVIECSDGSSKPGKKLGKEHWEHTKKWSQEFLELYNAETDLEIKSIMRDMGKDLDKWITEKEIQDVSDLMTRIPKKKRRHIEKKLDKLKREIEMFGHQAVVSKYREYSEEKEEDYLWWLDLNFILCIELYRTEDDAPKVGFYSLEMAVDLELNPKQYHVIAFEDAGDSKNFCYIIQAHLDMLGNGSAFVVARPPKDAFREAKANGFNVTVIRKGELKLNIDLTLEEVEEEIVGIGSKMYHDKIMLERSVGMGTLVKGFVNADKSTKRKPKRVPKKPTAC